MPSTLAPFGLRPVYHRSGQIRTEAMTIVSGYGTAIGKFAPVKLASDGTIQRAAAGDAFFGVLMGVEYKDSTGKPCFSPNWVASTTGTEIRAYVTVDQDIEYEVQANATLAQTAVGNCADFASAGAANVSGVDTYGLSTAGLDAATAGAATAQLSIVGFGRGITNAAGDTYPIVRVRIAEHQLSGTAVSAAV